jgi:hypothetical protein
MRTAVFMVFLSIALAVHAQQKDAQETHSDHREMMIRGDRAMGFSQHKATHHFRLFKDGGAIRDQIRQHLSHIARMFSTGDFQAPMFIHDTTPPGVLTMTRLREQIHYEFQETDRGARVGITATNPQAIDAIHAFLLFQIVSHQTGDSPDVMDDVPRK